MSGVLRYRPATATAVWDGYAFPEPTTDFENAEFEFARNHTITVCDA